MKYEEPNMYMIVFEGVNVVTTSNLDGVVGGDNDDNLDDF